MRCCSPSSWCRGRGHERIADPACRKDSRNGAVADRLPHHPEIVAADLNQVEDHPDWAVLSRLPMRLAAGVPLRRFTVRDLLALRAGQTIESAWSCSDDVPVEIGGVALGWSEFEVVEQRLAVRLTRLA